MFDTPLLVPDIEPSNTAATGPSNADVQRLLAIMEESERQQERERAREANQEEGGAREREVEDESSVEEESQSRSQDESEGNRPSYLPPHVIAAIRRTHDDVKRIHQRRMARQFHVPGGTDSSQSSDEELAKRRQRIQQQLKETPSVPNLPMSSLAYSRHTAAGGDQEVIATASSDSSSSEAQVVPGGPQKELSMQKVPKLSKIERRRQQEREKAERIVRALFSVGHSPFTSNMYMYDIHLC